MSSVSPSFSAEDHEPTSTPDTTPAGGLGDIANATKVGTGRSLHATPVGRGVWNRRLSEIFKGLGKTGDSEEERQLRRRIAALCVLAEKVEVRLANGKEVSAENYKQLSDAIGRAVERLAACRERNMPRDAEGKPTSLSEQWFHTLPPERLRDLATEIRAHEGERFVPREFAEFVEARTGQKVQPVEPPLDIEDPFETPEAKAALAELAKAIL